MTTKYPLCARAGLKVELTEAYIEPPTYVVRAADVEKLLEGAPVVHIEKNENWGWNGQEMDADECDYTHTARLLLIEKIEPKTCPTCGGKIENHKD